MRFISVALVLLLVLGCAQAHSLSGGSGDVKCTLFGTYQVPIPGPDANATATEYALNVDVGLIGSTNATYELVDGNDKIYHPEASRSKALQPGRQNLVFVVPPTGDAIGGGFKLFKVYPSEGQPFAINWWKTPKKIQGDITLRYYGITDLQIGEEGQSIAFDVKITNDGPSSIPISPENFTLIDQWGWDYYTLEGFADAVLEPKKSARVKVIFNSLSLLSKPSVLLYDGPSGQMTVDLEKDTGPLSDEVVYGTNAPTSGVSQSVANIAPASQTKAEAAKYNAADNSADNVARQNVTSTQSAASAKVMSLKDQINASKQRLANAFQPGSTISGKSAASSQISSSVSQAKERMAKAMEKMHDNTTQKNENANETINS
jgi:hypothetical protein